MIRLYQLKSNPRILLHRDDETGLESGWTGIKPDGPFDANLWNDLGQAKPEEELLKLQKSNRHKNYSQQKYNAAKGIGLTEIEARQLSGWER